MKFLTLEEIKQQLRIEPDFTEEDAILTRYGNSAEQSILRICNRSLENIVAYFGTEDEPIPSDIIHAALMLVDLSYQQRSPLSTTQLLSVGYAFDMKVKPYMKLANDTTSDNDVVLGSQAKILFSLDLPGDITMKDIDFSVKVRNGSKLYPVSVDIPKDDCIYVCDNSYVAIVNTADLGVGEYGLQVTAMIPDIDFETVTLLRDSAHLVFRTSDDKLLCVDRIPGLRKEVVNINPHVNVIP